MAAPIYRGGRPYFAPGIRQDNNTGVFNTASEPVDGTSGTLAGVAGPGSILMRTNGAVYVNTNTKASPTWVSLGVGAAGSTLDDPTLTGTVTLTGADVVDGTFAGATLTEPVINGPTITAPILSDNKVLVAAETFDADVTPGLITGFAHTVVAGTYTFDLNLFTTMTTNAGLTVAFKLTTAVLTSIQYATYAATASDNTTAVSTQGTTTTDLTEPFNSKTAAYTFVRVFGSMVVGTGGTFSWYGCQETSGTGADVTVLKIGSYSNITRVA
jgi:hypothetical protein